MEADDSMGPRQWATTSPEHFDRLARGVLRAARDAARELRRNPPDQDRRTWALGKLAGQTQAMLGPAFPDHPPLGAAAQEEFVRTALTLAVHVRAHSWAKADLGPVGVLGEADVPHPGERWSADAFDVLGRLMLPNSSPEGWTATLVTDLARGDQTLEAAVKLGKYVLHPTFLALADDATREIGKALHGINVRRLYELTHLLHHVTGHVTARKLGSLSATGPEALHRGIVRSRRHRGSRSVRPHEGDVDRDESDSEPVLGDVSFPDVSGLDRDESDSEPVLGDVSFPDVSGLDRDESDSEPVLGDVSFPDVSGLDRDESDSEPVLGDISFPDVSELDPDKPNIVWEQDEEERRINLTDDSGPECDPPRRRGPSI